jgi:hypothetical protein
MPQQGEPLMPTRHTATKSAPKPAVVAQKPNGEAKPDIKAGIRAIANDLDAMKLTNNADVLSTQMQKAVVDLRKLCEA